MTFSAKKFLLASGVIATFVVYSFVLRHQDSGAVIAPSSLKNKSQPTTTSSNSNSGTNTTARYKNGTYTGSVADAFYGSIQVQVSINGGKITDVQFLQFPNDSPNSQSINSQATPLLKQEAIQAQSAHVDGITGATDTSNAFVQSLGAALAKAQA